MTMLMIGGALLGATLGLRFKVLVLLPVTFIGVSGTVIFAILYQSSVAATIVLVVALATTLQAGYFAGLFVRFVLVAARAPRLRSASAPLARPSR